MADDELVRTRRALHGIAELLLAGPQHATTGHIKLRAVAGGFGTAFAPEVAVVGGDLVSGDRRIAIDGHTVRELAEALGITFADLRHVYRDVSGLDPDALVSIDADSAVQIGDVYAAGDAALRAFAPDDEPVLWPEHFDIAISVNGVNYGVTPGDDGIGTPYMYVGPWPVPENDEFWNEAFGAARPLPTSVEEIVDFFTEGRERAEARSS